MLQLEFFQKFYKITFDFLGGGDDESRRIGLILRLLRLIIILDCLVVDFFALL